MLIVSSILKGEPIEFLPLLFHLRIFRIWVDWAVGKVLIEIGCICVWGQDGHEGRLDALGQQRIPVDLLEPGVILDLIWTVCPEPVLWIFL